MISHFNRHNNNCSSKEYKRNIVKGAIFNSIPLIIGVALIIVIPYSNCFKITSNCAYILGAGNASITFTLFVIDAVIHSKKTKFSTLPHRKEQNKGVSANVSSKNTTPLNLTKNNHRIALQIFKRELDSLIQSFNPPTNPTSKITPEALALFQKEVREINAFFNPGITETQLDDLQYKLFKAKYKLEVSEFAQHIKNYGANIRPLVCKIAEDHPFKSNLIKFVRLITNNIESVKTGKRIIDSDLENLAKIFITNNIEDVEAGKRINSDLKDNDLESPKAQYLLVRKIKEETVKIIEEIKDYVKYVYESDTR